MTSQIEVKQDLGPLPWCSALGSFCPSGTGGGSLDGVRERVSGTEGKLGTPGIWQRGRKAPTFPVIEVLHQQRTGFAFPLQASWMYPVCPSLTAAIQACALACHLPQCSPPQLFQPQDQRTLVPAAVLMSGVVSDLQ